MELNVSYAMNLVQTNLFCWLLLYSKLGGHFFLKLEITQKVELVNTPNTLLGLRSNQSSGFSQVAAVVGIRRNRASALLLGLLVLVGISSFPANTVNNIAVAAESAAKSHQIGSTAINQTNRYVDQLRGDVSRMQTQYTKQSNVLVAQAYPLSVNNRAPATSIPTTNLQFTGEVSVPIEVAAPKTRAFKPAPIGQAYSNQSGSEGESKDYEDKTPATQTTGTTTIGFSWPAAGKLTSRYGRRWGRMHKGIDIAGPIGTPINAAADGTVIAAGWNSGGYGNLVEIKHNDGTTTRYGHNSRLSVAVGQTVRQGQQLAEMGSTGHSTGSHLHFEIRPSGGHAVNPIAHLPANS
jgi:murein DD-endopeptidase MepM/ murein hydrolase activator NlpD